MRSLPGVRVLESFPYYKLKSSTLRGVARIDQTVMFSK